MICIFYNNVVLFLEKENYITQYCAFASKLKTSTNKDNIREIDLSQYPERMDEMIIKSMAQKVPKSFLEKPILATVITFITSIRLVS